MVHLILTQCHSYRLPKTGKFHPSYTLNINPSFYDWSSFTPSPDQLPLGVMSLYLLLYSFLGHQLFLLPLNLLSLSSCPLSIPRWTVLRQGIDLEKMLSVHSDPLNTEDWGWGGSTCTNSCKTKLNRKISRFFWWSPQFITFDYTYCCLGFNNQPTTDCLK